MANAKRLVEQLLENTDDTEIFVSSDGELSEEALAIVSDSERMLLGPQGSVEFGLEFEDFLSDHLAGNSSLRWSAAFDHADKCMVQKIKFEGEWVGFEESAAIGGPAAYFLKPGALVRVFRKFMKGRAAHS